MTSLPDEPAFMKPPREGHPLFEVFRQRQEKDKDDAGYLNFVIILHRLKAKKYGPGRNIIKEEVLQHHIRSVFKYCEDYFSQDEVSMRVARVLLEFFEYQLKHSPNPKTAQFKKPSN